MKKLFGYDYTNNNLVKFILYGCVGVSATLVDLLVFYICVYYIFKSYLLEVYASMFGVFFSFIISTLWHYFISNIFVFTSGVRYSKEKEIFLVFVISLFGLLLNLSLIYIFVGLLYINPVFSRILCSFICIFYNFYMRKKYVFS